MRTSTTSAATNSSHSDPSSGWRRRWRSARLPSLIGGLLGLLVIIAAYFHATSVSGIELNAATWELREFSFRRDPFTNRQWTGIRHSAPLHFPLWSSGTGQTTAKLDPTIRPLLRNRVAARWDLVELQGRRTGPAAILTESLGAYTKNFDYAWTRWTSDHPRKAALLWPAIHTLVELEAYPWLPSLFELALLPASVEDFRVALSEEMQKLLLDYCRQLTLRGEVLKVKAAAEAGNSYGKHPAFEEFLSISEQK